MDLTALDEMTDAMAHAILTFAMTSSAGSAPTRAAQGDEYDPGFRGSHAIK